MLFSFFALAGDLGCSCGPSLAGLVAEMNQNNLQMGILFAIVFPIVLVLGIVIIRKKYKK
ncbi:MAG: hypothetical protein U0L05_07460 [Schaedlerella sp.]|nr:hypothetical protein [Schaedlerella sp.]